MTDTAATMPAAGQTARDPVRPIRPGATSRLPPVPHAVDAQPSPLSEIADQRRIRLGGTFRLDKI